MVERTNCIQSVHNTQGSNLVWIWGHNQWDHNQLEAPWDFHKLCARPYSCNQTFHYIVRQDHIIQCCAYKTFDKATHYCYLNQKNEKMKKNEIIQEMGT